jgi:hypothetical protein
MLTPVLTRRRPLFRTVRREGSVCAGGDGRDGGFRTPPVHRSNRTQRPAPTFAENEISMGRFLLPETRKLQGVALSKRNIRTTEVKSVRPR